MSAFRVPEEPTANWFDAGPSPWESMPPSDGQPLGWSVSSPEPKSVDMLPSIPGQSVPAQVSSPEQDAGETSAEPEAEAGEAAADRLVKTVDEYSNEGTALTAMGVPPQDPLHQIGLASYAKDTVSSVAKFAKTGDVGQLLRAAGKGVMTAVSFAELLRGEDYNSAWLGFIEQMVDTTGLYNPQIAKATVGSMIEPFTGGEPVPLLPKGEPMLNPPPAPETAKPAEPWSWGQPGMDPSYGEPEMRPKLLPMGPIDTSPQLPMGPIDTSRQLPMGPIDTSRQLPMGPIDTSPQLPMGPIDTSPQLPMGPIDTSPQLPMGPIDTSPQLPMGPIDTSPQLPMVIERGGGSTPSSGSPTSTPEGGSTGGSGSGLMGGGLIGGALGAGTDLFRAAVLGDDVSAGDVVRDTTVDAIQGGASQVAMEAIDHGVVSAATPLLGAGAEVVGDVAGGGVVNGIVSGVTSTLSNADAYESGQIDAAHATANVAVDGGVGLAGGLAGAATGAAIGSIVPGAGTALGAGLGFAGGGLASLGVSMLANESGFDDWAKAGLGAELGAAEQPLELLWNGVGGGMEGAEDVAALAGSRLGMIGTDATFGMMAGGPLGALAGAAVGAASEADAPGGELLATEEQPGDFT